LTAISTTGLTKRFRGGQLAVDHIDLAVPDGSVYGFLGPNGSGKTTTIRMLLGLAFPTAGQAALLEVPMPAGASQVLHRVGSLVEGPAFYPFLTGSDNLARYDAADRTADPRTARARIETALDRVGLLAAAKKRYRNYSLGMKQRLAIAAGLLRPRELIILDEPTNGLDPQGTREVRALIRQIAADGTTVFVSSHLLAEVEQICTHVGVMRTGRLVFQGSLPELRHTGSARVTVQTADPEAAAKVLAGLGLADAQVASGNAHSGPRPKCRPKSRHCSATRRRSRSAPSSSTPGSESAASRSPHRAWKTCSSASPARASMSAAEVSVRAGHAVRPVRAHLRFFTAELRLVFRRRRNLLLLAVTAVFPLVIGIALRLAAPRPQGGNGAGVAFFNQLAGNGVFLTFIALSTLLVLILPVVVAVVAGDSVAGEAGYGTLRYLLAVPAGRTRLLAVKYGAIVTFGLCATFIVSAVALVAGAVLFPVGSVTLLSGTTVSLPDGLVRLLLVTLYVAAAMAALGAIGLAVSTMTEHAIGAIATVMILVVASEVVDNVPQLAAVGPYLPTHWWLSFDALLRAPVDTSTLLRGLLSFAVYALLFCSFAWARFTSADVTS
jgi:ABC-2 type transport system ATP-binding protein